jgi:hypothetical protein
MSNLFFALCLSVLPLTTQNANVSVSSEKIVLEEKIADGWEIRNVRNVQFLYGNNGRLYLSFEADIYFNGAFIGTGEIKLPLKTNEITIKGSKGETYTDPELLKKALEIASQY